MSTSIRGDKKFDIELDGYIPLANYHRFKFHLLTSKSYGVTLRISQNTRTDFLVMLRQLRYDANYDIELERLGKTIAAALKINVLNTKTSSASRAPPSKRCEIAKSSFLQEIHVDENHGENRFQSENGNNADAISKLFPVAKITKLHTLPTSALIKQQI